MLLLIQVYIEVQKKSAKSNHATVLKYIAAELQKCNIGKVSNDKIYGNNALTVVQQKTASKASAAAT